MPIQNEEVGVVYLHFNIVSARLPINKLFLNLYDGLCLNPAYLSKKRLQYFRT